MSLDYENWKQQNWDRAHRESDITALTGTGLEGHLTTLRVRNLLIPGASVLCVGVGMGKWVLETAEITDRVWALDISHVAAVRMPKNSNFTTDPQKLPPNHFDLAMSLWVAPHMSNHDLQEQVTGVVRSLKPDGVFAVHYKEPLDPNAQLDNREGASDEFSIAMSAMMLRRRKHLASMVSWAGGEVICTVNEQVSQFYQIIEAVAHIKKTSKSLRR